MARLTSFQSRNIPKSSIEMRASWERRQRHIQHGTRSYTERDTAVWHSKVDPANSSVSVDITNCIAS